MADVNDQTATGRSIAADFADVINRHSAEQPSNTPDIVLGAYLADCLAAFNTAVAHRTRLAEGCHPSDDPYWAEK